MSQKLHNRIIQKKNTEHGREIHREIYIEIYRYISSEQRQKIIDDLRLIW